MLGSTVREDLRNGLIQRLCGSPGDANVPAQVCSCKEGFPLCPVFGVLHLEGRQEKSCRRVRNQTAGTVTPGLQGACSLGGNRP